MALESQTQTEAAADAPAPLRAHKSKIITPFIPLPAFPEPLRPAGQIFVWGTGNFGQFGMGPNLLDEFATPRRNTWVEDKIAEGVFGTESGAGVVAVAAGGMHSMFVDENGKIWSCGVNDDAALGRITKDVPDPDNPGNFLNIDILTSIPHPLQSLVDDKFRAAKIAAGDSISAAISTEGELRVWGSFRANEGSLGFASGNRLQFLPEVLLPGQHCVALAAGNNHLVVLTTQGTLYSWGAGEQGQLGRKIIERRKIHGTVPERVVLGSRTRRAVAVGAGNMHSFAVDEAGDVWGWGLNSAGQTGTGTNPADTDGIVQTPRRVQGLSAQELGDGARVVQIAGGDLHTLFLTSDGRVYACGRGDACQLGVPDAPDSVDAPVLVPFPDAHTDDPVVAVSAGTRFNAAVTRAGALYAWGEGAQGELGVKGEERVEEPTVVVRREGGSWAAVGVSCGGQHSLGLFRKRT
ncbi:RCC1/BLIP-II [Auriscalpium vulgare]|uniref:RCC1/BLIP-II n=1 Tax=Auriscalpium vulgare TaxID=40419 RepID=A0ACB8RF31_9AGAM|nr:RCC1/BLIP-II [Auriscalpium vulgare]